MRLVIYCSIILVLLSSNMEPAFAQVKSEEVNQTVEVQKQSYITKADLEQEIENLKKDIQGNSVTSDKLYETILEIKDDRVSMMDSNLSSIIGFSQIFLAIVSVVIAVTIGWVSKKLKVVNSLKKQVEKVQYEVEESLKKAKSLEQIYSNIPAQNFFHNLSSMSEDNNNSKEEINAFDQIEDIDSQKENAKNTTENPDKSLKPHRLQRGDIYMVDFGDTVGAEIRGIRPALIVQNDIGNRFSPSIIVAPIATITKEQLPTHVSFNLEAFKGTVLLEQVRTLDRQRLNEYIIRSDAITLARIDDALKISLGLTIF